MLTQIKWAHNNTQLCNKMAKENSHATKSYVPVVFWRWQKALHIEIKTGTIHEFEKAR